MNISEPVIASDEAIYLDFLNEEQQPGACIKRIVSENASDVELIKFYSNLIKQKNTQQDIQTCRVIFILFAQKIT